MSQEPVAIVGAAAVSPYGFGWRGLARSVRERRLSPGPSRELRLVREGALSFEVPDLSSEVDSGDPKNRKLMSRAARLATVAARAALEEAGWRDARDEIGCFLGIGAGGGPLDELRAMLLASLETGRFSQERFAQSGLATTNPLFAFHLLTNFTLCHGAIAHGLGGPNGAWFSRGSGTLVALTEAIEALGVGDCDRALAGGADCALYAGTFLELDRGQYLSRGLVPGEGAALLTLARDAAKPLARVTGWALDSDKARPISNRISDLLGFFDSRIPDALVIAPWGTPTREALFEALARRCAKVLDATASLGESLAASPALAWVVGLDWLLSDGLESVGVLSAGIDGDLGAVLLTRGEPR